jgi:hypothetical protein
MKTGCNLAESSKEGFDPKRAGFFSNDSDEYFSEAPIRSPISVTAATDRVMENAIFWDITLSILLKQTSAFYLLHAGFLLGLFFDPEDEGNMFLWNIS